MHVHANRCPSCELVNPRAWRTCARCAYALERDAAPPPPLVGQAPVAEAIHANIDRAFSLGAPTLVAIEGPRGSGKSRLLAHAAEFAARAGTNVRLLHATAGASSSPSPYEPFSTLLLDRFDATPGAPAAAVRGQMTTIVGRALGAADAVTVVETTHLLGLLTGVEFPDSPFLLPLTDRPHELKRRVTQALRQFVEGDAQQQPLIVLIDDAHTMPETAWRVLGSLLEVAGHIAVVVAGDTGTIARAQEFGPAERTATATIEPMNESDVAALLFLLVPTLENTPEPLIAGLLHRSGGNANALRALIFSLLEQDFFLETNGATRCDMAKLEEGHLPVTMDDVVAARLGRLSDFDREALTRAAVVGERFWDGAVLAQARWESPAPERKGVPALEWADDRDHAELDSALARLVDKGFIAPISITPLPGAQEYRFQLSLAREQLYRAMDENVKVQRHTAVAGWLSVTAELQREGVAALIAPHLEEAGWLHRAGRAYFEAAAYERARLRTHSALAHIERALPLLPDEDVVRRIDAFHEKGSLLAMLGRYDEAFQAFASMFEHAHRIGALGKGAAALNRIGRIHRERGEEDRAEPVLARALEMFRAAGDLRGVASTLDDLAQVVRLRQEPSKAIPLAAEALELRRAHGDRRGEAVSLNTLGTIEYSRGHIDAAELYFTQALELRVELGDQLGIMQCHNALAVLAYEQGNVEAAVTAWTAALSHAREIGARREQSFMLNNLGEAHLALGQTDQAKARLEEAHRLAAALGDKRAVADIARNLGAVALRLGQADADSLFEQALKSAEAYGGREAIALAHRAIAQSRAQSGDPSRTAERDFVASIDLFRTLGNEREAAKGLAELGQYFAEREDNAHAKQHLTEARALMQRMGLPGLERVEATLRAIDAP